MRLVIFRPHGWVRTRITEPRVAETYAEGFRSARDEIVVVDGSERVWKGRGG